MYSLYANDGDILDEEIHHPEHVPRIGEWIVFDQLHSYRVVDVLWHMRKNGERYVTVTALEMDWHENIDKVINEWRMAQRR